MKAWIKPNMCLYVSHMIDLSLPFDYVGYCLMIGYINSLSFALFVTLPKFNVKLKRAVNDWTPLFYFI